MQKIYVCSRKKGGLTQEQLAGTEKALKKYPNAFEIVYNCAVLYNVFGLESQDKRLLRPRLEIDITFL